MSTDKHTLVDQFVTRSFGILHFNRNNVITKANRTICEHLGYRQDSLIGSPLSQVTDGSALQAWKQGTAASDESPRFSIDLITADNLRLQQDAWLIAQDDAEETVLLIDVSSNGTDQELPAPAPANTLHVLSCDVDGRITDISFFGMEILGWSKEEITGRNFAEVFSHASIPNHKKMLEEVAAGKHERAQLSLAARGGHLHSLSVSIAPDYSEDSSWRLLAHTMAYDPDRAALRQEIINQILIRSHTAHTLEELIRGSSELLKRFAGADAVGIRLQDGSNYPYYEISGFSNSFTVEENIICPASQQNKDNPELECFCGAILQQNIIEELDGFTGFGSFVTNNALDLVKQLPGLKSKFTVRGKCLRDGYLSVALIPLRLRGEIHGLLQLNSFEKNAFSKSLINQVQEIADHLVIAISNFRTTEQLQIVNEELQHKNENLTKLNKELQLFSASVTHDLRSPLNQIKQYVELIRRHTQENENEEVSSFFDKLMGLVPRMQQMISSFIELTKISETTPMRTTIDICKMARSVFSDLQSERDGKAAELVADGELNVTADPGFLRIVLSNLISNAVKYSGDAEVARVEVGMKTLNGEPCYYVRDNGMGINPDEFDKLFKPFSRLSNSRHRIGTGIGLASVRRAVERMGGTVWCESRPGTGATFYFTIDSSGAPLPKAG